MIGLIMLVHLVTGIDGLDANVCSSRYYETIGTEGPSLPPDEIISSHEVESVAVEIKCYSLCQKEPRCVGFNHRTTATNDENCQLTNVTKKRNTTKKGDWTLRRDVEAMKKQAEKGKKNDSGNPVKTSSSAVASKVNSTGANQSTGTREKNVNMTVGMKNSPSNITEGAHTSYSSSQGDNAIKASSTTPSNNMVTGLPSFVENMKSSTVDTTFVIQTSAVAPSTINSEIYSVSNFPNHSMASKTMGSDARAHVSESEILKNESVEFSRKLGEWVNKPGNWNVCWRGTRDGMTAKAFHAGCDGKIPTLMIVKVITNNKSLVFGGYATESWAGESAYGIAAPGSFLFSLGNNDDLPPFKAPLKDENSSYAIFQLPGEGPNFGKGHDLFISISGSTTKSYANFGHTYQAPPGYAIGEAKTQSLLAGSSEFTPTEVEVLSLV